MAITFALIPPDRWDMLCACTFVDHVQEPRFSFVAKIL